MNILIPTDFSENSWNAIRYALKLFEKVPVRFYFLHVKTGQEEPAYQNTLHSKKPENTLTLSKAPFSILLKRLKKETLSKRHQFYTAMAEGVFTGAIRKKIEQLQIDMIVMGTNGASGYREATVGRNTTDVITRVKCPVLVIPAKAKYVPPKDICLPTDFNNFFKLKVIKTLKSIVDLNTSALSVLYVSKKNKQLSALQEKHKNQLRERLYDIHHSFHFNVDQTLEEAVEAFVQPREIGMIAMMAKNLNFFQHILFHPAAREISYHSEIPFLVLHE